MEWKVGDRVKVVETVNRRVVKIYKGLQGTVIGVHNSTILVEFDEYIGGHDGNSVKGFLGKDGYCWWFSEVDEQYTYGIPTLEEGGVVLEKVRGKKKNNYW